MLALDRFADYISDEVNVTIYVPDSYFRIHEVYISLRPQIVVSGFWTVIPCIQGF